MSSYVHRFRELVNGQWLGWLLALALGATCVSAALWLVLALLRSSSAKPAVWTLATLSASLLLAGSRMALERAETLRLIVQIDAEIDPSQRARLIAESLSRLFLTSHYASAVVALATSAAICAVVRQRAGLRPPRLGLLAMSLTLLSAGALYLANQKLLISTCGGEISPQARRFEQLAESRDLLRSGQLGVLGVGGCAWLVMLLGAAQRAGRQLVASNRSLLVSTGLLVAGITAAACTRDARADTTHLVPVDPSDVTTCLGSQSLQARLPAAPSGCLALEGPLVEIAGGSGQIDGSATTSPADVEHVLTGKRKLWQLLNPGRKLAGIVLFAAPEASRTRELLPWLAAVHRAGYSELGVYSRAPPVRIHPRTFGAFQKVRCCATVWTVDPSATLRLTHFETWADLASSERERPRSISLE